MHVDILFDYGTKFCDRMLLLTRGKKWTEQANAL